MAQRACKRLQSRAGSDFAGRARPDPQPAALWFRRGEQSAKNIARPVRVYALPPEAIAGLPAVSLLIAKPCHRIARVAMAAIVTAALIIAGGGCSGRRQNSRRQK